MGDVHGGLLKCVLQLAACSDKVRRAVRSYLALSLSVAVCAADSVCATAVCFVSLSGK